MVVGPETGGALVRRNVTHFVRADGTTLCEGWASDMGPLRMNTLYCCGVCLQRLYALISLNDDPAALGKLSLLGEHELRRLHIVQAHRRAAQRKRVPPKPN